MRKTSLVFMILGLFALALGGACGGDDDGGGGGTPDARRLPDSGPLPDAPLQADAPPPVSAMHLGESCTGQAADCGGLLGTGYSCITLNSDMNVPGFCTIACQQGNNATCANGYTGPGTPGCFLTNQTQTEFFCAVGCGMEVTGMAMDTMCPGVLMCGDVNANGTNDLCTN